MIITDYYSTIKRYQLNIMINYTYFYDLLSDSACICKILIWFSWFSLSLCILLCHSEIPEKKNHFTFIRVSGTYE